MTAAVEADAVGLRPMTRADFGDLLRWRSAPHVARWFPTAEAATPELIEERYGPRVDGVVATRMFVVEAHGRSVGFLQDYRISDHPEYAIATGAPDAIGFDYAIGEASLVGRGIGTRVLWLFLRDVVRPNYPEAVTYFAAPDHRNAVSLRVLDKLGFEQGLWFDEPRADGRVDTVVSCTLDVPRVFG